MCVRIVALMFFYYFSARSHAKQMIDLRAVVLDYRRPVDRDCVQALSKVDYKHGSLPIHALRCVQAHEYIIVHTYTGAATTLCVQHFFLTTQ
jgi:hypothetical protein